MNDLFEEVKVAENDVCTFHTSSFTKGAEDWAKQWGLDGIQCVIARQKSNPEDADYALIEKGQFIFSHKSYEAIGVHIDSIAISRGKKII